MIFIINFKMFKYLAASLAVVSASDCTNGIATLATTMGTCYATLAAM